MKVRSEGLGLRATGLVLGKSGSSIINWEKRLSDQISNWSPPAQAGSESLSKEMKFTLALARTSPPAVSEGWTIHFIERNSRYWVDAPAGLKDASLFEKGVKAVWDRASPSKWIRWFTDGERRYGKELSKLASVYLSQDEKTHTF